MKFIGLERTSPGEPHEVLLWNPMNKEQVRRELPGDWQLYDPEVFKKIMRALRWEKAGPDDWLAFLASLEDAEVGA